MRALFLIAALAGCSHDKPENIGLRQLYEKKLALASGWPSSTECDGALWAGVARRAGGDADLSQAVSYDGRPTRRPGSDCSVPDESASTTSNDMMTGIILGLVAQRDLDSLQRLWHYGTEHDWVMGDGLITRTLLRPNGVILLARAIHFLGGPDYAVRITPVTYFPVKEDYEKHLQYLSVLLQRDMSATPVIGTAIVCADADPFDALAQAVCGNKLLAEQLLLNPHYAYPTYVRGDPAYQTAHWLLAAKVTLE